MVKKERYSKRPTAIGVYMMIIPKARDAGSSPTLWLSAQETSDSPTSGYTIRTGARPARRLTMELLKITPDRKLCLIMRDKNYKVDKYEEIVFIAYCPECKKGHEVITMPIKPTGTTNQEEVECPECDNMYIVEAKVDIQVFHKQAPS